jgi:hypothetical protein
VRRTATAVLLLLIAAFTLAPNRSPDHQHNEHQQKQHGENGALSVVGHSIDLTSPLDLATGVSDTVTCQWSTDTVFTYSLYLDTLPAPTTVRASALADTFTLVSNLAYGTTYYWFVVAHATVDSLISETWSFTTIQPYALDSTQLWLDPLMYCYSDSNYTKCVDGSTVLFWKNRLDTTVFYSQVTAVKRPLYEDSDGNPRLIFNGTSNYLICNSTTFLAYGTSHAMTVWTRAAMTATQPTTSSYLLGKFRYVGSGSTGGWICCGISTTQFGYWFLSHGGLRYAYVGGSTNIAVTVTNYAFAYTPVVLQDFATAVSIYWGTSAQGETSGAAGGDVASATDLSASSIMGRNDGAALAAGAIYFLAFYKSQLTTNQIGGLNSWGNAQ